MTNQEKLDLIFPLLGRSWKKVSAQFLKLHQMELRVDQGFRSFSEQLNLWNLGRKKEGDLWVITDIKKVVTHAMPGQSFHQYGLAIDSCFVGKDPYLKEFHPAKAQYFWQEYGRLCKSEGMTWGGNFKNLLDMPHCEMNFGFTIHEMQIMYEKIGIDGIWDECKKKALCGGELDESNSGFTQYREVH